MGSGLRVRFRDKESWLEPNPLPFLLIHMMKEQSILYSNNSGKD